MAKRVKEQTITEVTMPDVITSDIATSDKTSDIATTMLQYALEKGLDTSTIEKLLDLRERIKIETAKAEFIQALTGFQAELPAIEKDKVVFNKDGSIRYKYASFDNIIKCIKPILKKYGLSYRFETTFDENNIKVTCIIQHVSGHAEKTTFQIPIDTSMHMSIIQRYGSSLTYAKRYSLTLALGLATEEDDDVISSIPEEINGKSVLEENKQTQGEMITEAQRRALFSICSRLQLTEAERLYRASVALGRDINSFNELTKKEASILIEVLQKEPF